MFVTKLLRSRDICKITWTPGTASNKLWSMPTTYPIKYLRTYRYGGRKLRRTWRRGRGSGRGRACPLFEMRYKFCQHGQRQKTLSNRSLVRRLSTPKLQFLWPYFQKSRQPQRAHENQTFDFTEDDEKSHRSRIIIYYPYLSQNCLGDRIQGQPGKYQWPSNGLGGQPQKLLKST